MAAFEELKAGDPQQVGPYRIVARLGAGGMGRVYLGHSRGRRAVAVKVVRPELAESEDFRRRFAREVAAARRVNGIFTAAVVAADPDGDPAWLATAFVAGMSLEEAVAAHRPWPAASVLALGAALAEALEAIHAAGVIHRDLKPSNVLLAVDGPRVIDFGISVAGETSRLTHTGMVVGTPGFMSPEQVTGKPVGVASDIFSLGAVLAFTATGTGPFGTGSAHSVNFRAVYEEPELKDLPRALSPVVTSCLAKEPARRPTVSALLDQLAEVTGSERVAPELLAEADWLPAPVARSLRSHPEPPQLPRQKQPRTAPSGTDSAPTQTATQASAPTPPARARFSRRRVLIGLAGASVASAGLGFAAWRILGDGADGPGTLRWKRRIAGSVWSLTATKDALYAGSGDTNLYAVDADTGEQLWKSPTGDRVASYPAVAGGVVYAGSRDGYLYAVDANTGGQRWKFRALGDVLSSPAVVNGVVYVGSSDGYLHAVDAETGEKRWEFGTSNYVDSSPTIADGVVYFGSGDGYLHAVNTATGKQRWRLALGGEVFSSPAIADGVVYVGSGNGNLYAADADTGKERWKFPTGDSVDSSPATVDGVVYVGSGDGYLYALDAGTGKQRWRLSASLPQSASPVVTKGVVYIVGGGDHLYAVDANTGEKRWQFTASGRDLALAVAGGVVYAGSGDGYVYAVTA